MGVFLHQSMLDSGRKQTRSGSAASPTRPNKPSPLLPFWCSHRSFRLLSLARLDTDPIQRPTGVEKRLDDVLGATPGAVGRKNWLVEVCAHFILSILGLAGACGLYSFLSCDLGSSNGSSSLLSSQRWHLDLLRVWNWIASGFWPSPKVEAYLWLFPCRHTEDAATLVNTSERN